MSHTPGPWKATNFGKHGATAWVCGDMKHAKLIGNHDPKRLDICCVDSAAISISENEANAQLIAAAPEMLTALKAMVANYKPALKDLGIVSDPRAVQLALKAIAMAESKS